MKHIHVIVDDGDYKKLDKAKGSKTWRDFLLDKSIEVHNGKNK